MNTQLPLRRIRSFVRRDSRLSNNQREALTNLWPIYGLDFRQENFDLQAAFSVQNSLCIEIGFGMGHALLAMAQIFPDKNFIGIDIHRPGIGHVLSELQRLQLTNVRVVAADAVEFIQAAVKPHSIHEAYLFFPDPWPKRRHHKRRLLQSSFLKLLEEKLKPEGQFYLATDIKDYALHMLKTFKEVESYRNVSPTQDFVARPSFRPLTRFEQRGHRLGNEVYDLLFCCEKEKS